MPFTFLELCLRSDADFAVLHRRTDACARLGRSYEIPCLLPAECSPRNVFIGFCRSERQYSLYIRPQVRYSGHNAELAALFHPTLHTFPSFSHLTALLHRLGQHNGTRYTPPIQYDQLTTALGQQVFGQDAAVDAVSCRLYAHLCKRHPQRPLSVVLYGPTGVGKSELAKSIAPILNTLQPNRHWNCVWTELNTFTQPHSAYRLIGSPPGYVGYDDPPVLESIRENPFTVYVFDELDKAHIEVWKVFMSILDEGRCSARRADEHGQRELDFRNCIFIFTTNLPLSSAPTRLLGFAPPADDSTGSLSSVNSPIFRHLEKDELARRSMILRGIPAEIACRFTALIGFRPLDDNDRLMITAKQIVKLGSEFGLHIVSVSPSAAAALTPQNAVSVRSTPSVLERILTPIFVAHISRGGSKEVCLSDNAGLLYLSAAESPAS